MIICNSVQICNASSILSIECTSRVPNKHVEYLFYFGKIFPPRLF